MPESDERRAYREFKRSMSPEAIRLTNLHGRAGVLIPHTLVYRSWPTPGDQLAARLPEQVKVESAFGELTRESPIFLLDIDQLLEVANSGEAGEPPPHLPPLPFESILIETYPDGYVSVRDDGTCTSYSATQITEIDRGRVWEVCQLSYEARWTPTSPALIPTTTSITQFHVCDDGTRDCATTSNQQSRMRDGLAALIIEAVHLITATGVTHEPPPRPIRRDYERVSRKKWPTNAWLIKIGENTPTTDNHSDRHLTCRFRVRGHWARLANNKAPSGRVPWREDPDGFLVWRDAFVKGPAGAPWRVPADPVRLVA